MYVLGRKAADALEVADRDTPDLYVCIFVCMYWVSKNSYMYGYMYSVSHMYMYAYMYWVSKNACLKNACLMCMYVQLMLWKRVEYDECVAAMHTYMHQNKQKNLVLEGSVNMHA
jgi:hypothetical protein